jgi:sterol desaturase/sphingolipid hydroxylase (fatty acid hydroxylase superfamily)
MNVGSGILAPLFFMDKKPLLVMAALAAIFLLEGIFPYYLGRQKRALHAVPHLVTAVVNAFLTRLLLAGITMQVIFWAGAHGLGLMRMLALQFPARMIAVFILFDVWMYYWHMLNHRIPFLWRFHRAHHADIAMDTTTALRFHPGELVLSTVARTPVLVLIGMSFTELALFETILNLSTVFHHSNLAVPERWDRMLRTIIVTPNMHRVHHAVERADTNSNYTSILSIWDRLAGTFRMREDTRTITLGLPSFREEQYQRLWGFIRTPFV